MTGETGHSAPAGKSRYSLNVAATRLLARRPAKFPLYRRVKQRAGAKEGRHERTDAPPRFHLPLGGGGGRFALTQSAMAALSLAALALAAAVATLTARAFDESNGQSTSAALRDQGKGEKGNSRLGVAPA